MSFGPRWGLALSFALLAHAPAAATATAHAEPKHLLTMIGEPQRCPSAPQLAKALEQFLPSARIVSSTNSASAPVPPKPDAASPPDAVTIGILDLGDRFEVYVRDEERDFSDGNRRCEERAREAALFIALVLEPPFIAEAPASVTPPPRRPTSPPLPPQVDARPTPAAAPPAPADAPPPTRDRLSSSASIVLEAGPLVVVGLDSSRFAGGGAFARMSVIWGNVGFALGVGPWGAAPAGPSSMAESSRTLQAQISFWLTRISYDLSLRLELRRPRFELAADVGLSLAPLIASTKGSDDRTSSVGVGFSGANFSPDLAIRIGGVVRIAVKAPVIPFLGLELNISPVEHDLNFHVYKLGSVPIAWLGISAGITFRSR